MYDTDDLRAVSQRLKKAGSHNYGDTAVAMALDTYLMGRDESRCKADVGPLDLEAIESRAQRLMIATWECDKLSYTDQWQLTSRDVPALVAEVRRLHAELDAANKRIKELEATVTEYANTIADQQQRINRLKDEVEEHRRHVATVMGREGEANERIKTLERRIDEKTDEINRLRRQLAERDADAEVGRAVRYLRCKPGHSCVTFHLRVYPGQDMHPPQCWISWARDMGGSGSTRYGTIQGVIDTYYEGKD